MQGKTIPPKRLEAKQLVLTHVLLNYMHAKVHGPDHAICMFLQMWRADESAASALAPVSPEDCPQDSQAAAPDLESPAILQPTTSAAIHQLPSPACKV